MPNKTIQFLALSLVFFSALGSAIGASAEEKKIDRVRTKALSKGVLDDSDLRVIDDFVSASLEDLVHAEDYTELAEVRCSISDRKGRSGQNQYTAAFLMSARKHISRSLETVDSFEDNRLKIELYRNLAVLVVELENADLVHLIFPLLDHTNTTVHYWAVKALSSDSVLAKLNAAVPDKEFSDKIIGALQSHIATSKPETLSLIVDFASNLEHPRTIQILRDIADVRIKSYEDWSVEQELMDAALLKAIASVIVNPAFSSDKPLLGRKFAQLYSYVIQRYMATESLGERSKLHLASVIVDVESSTLSSLIGKRQSTIKKAVESGSFSSLQRACDLLLGSSTAAGSLPTALRFTYGKENGKTLTGPKKLPVRPKPKVEVIPENPGS
ncbi:MAG TPA: hypothetical protein ENH94_02795 [Phycisphaerales bacterium]|nr:hypothetical protein [Phycisphaerales bacterium]